MTERVWKAQPKQRAFILCEEDEAFYGGSAGGGKSDALLAFCIRRRIKHPGSRGLILRRTYAELEKEGSLIPRSHQLLAGTAVWNGGTRKWTFPNGSVMEFGYCQYEQDVYQFQSAQYDDVCFDEATHFTGYQYLYLIGRCRTTRTDLKPLIRAASNPGNIGHSFFKKRFIDVAPPLTKYVDELGRTRFFIPATLYDNKVLMESDPTYELRLKQLPERERLALLHGRWDLYAGQYFSEFDYKVHVVPQDFKIEDWWYRYGAYDHGFNHPYSFGWYAVDGDGNVYKYRELMGRHKRPDEIAAEIHSFPDTKQLKWIVAGQDCWSTQRDGGPTIALQFSRLPENIRVTLRPANIDRIQGAQQMRAYLAHQNLPPGRRGPRFFLSSGCIRTIDAIQRMIHDPRRVEDVLKVDATEDDMYCGDDAYDETRYFLMSQPQIATNPDQDFIGVPNDVYQQQRVQRFQERKRKRARMLGEGGAIDPQLGKNW